MDATGIEQCVYTERLASSNSLSAQVWCCGACARGLWLWAVIRADESVRRLAARGTSARAASTICVSAVTAQAMRAIVRVCAWNCLWCRNWQAATGNHQKNQTPSLQGHHPRTQILFPLPVAECNWFITPSPLTAMHWTCSSFETKKSDERSI
jgi:hypothetical protein